MRVRVAVVIAGVLAAGCGSGTLTGPSASDGALPPVPPAIPTPIIPVGPQVFAGAGDIAMCDGNADRTARLLDTIGGTIFTLGDHAYFEGTRQEFRDCYDPTWGRHRTRTRPVPGNHDYQTSGALPYFEYFGANAGPSGLGYYSFDVGAWHAIALNSNIDMASGSSQAQWLRRDLAANASPCTVAYWHHPLYSSGPSGGSPRGRDIWRILYAAGADVILGGHDHLYERFAPQDPDGAPDRVRGMRQFIVGTGGAYLYPPGAPRPNSDARLSAFGVLKLTLRAGSYDWEFVALSGTGDAGSDICR